MTGRLPAPHDLELALWLGPPTGEYVAVHTRRAPYRPARTWVFGAMTGIGLGRVFHRYLLDGTDLVVWLVLGTVAATWLGAAALYQLRS